MDLVRTEGGINKTSLDCAQRQVLMMMMIIRPNYVTCLYWLWITQVLSNTRFEILTAVNIKITFSEMWRRVAWQTDTSVPEEHEIAESFESEFPV